jgi:hypothetical protein
LPFCWRIWEFLTVSNADVSKSGQKQAFGQKPQQLGQSLGNQTSNVQNVQMSKNDNSENLRISYHYCLRIVFHIIWFEAIINCRLWYWWSIHFYDGTAYPSGQMSTSPIFNGVSVAQSLVFCVVVCR